MSHDPKISNQGGITQIGKAKVANDYNEVQQRDDTTISEDVPDWMKIKQVRASHALCGRL